MEAHKNSAAEVREVLSKYLELFHQHSVEFKYHLAPNCVIDWYGRSVRGSIKIHDYLRHEVRDKFDHIDFLQAEPCAPIETKTSHMRTKIISSKPIDTVHPINRVPDTVPLKPYADSDVEDNEQPISSRFASVGVQNTPEKCMRTLPIQHLTPPASVTKNEEVDTVSKHSEDEDIIPEAESKRNRKKRTHSGSFTYLKRLPTAPSTSKRRRDSDGIRTLLDDTSSEEDELETMEALYTPLRYLQVNGIMKVKSSLLGINEKSAIWGERNELETRLRISYRRNLEDQQLQFALIIYEPRNCANIVTHTRRNLMSQFAVSVVDSPQNADNERGEQFVEETVLETMSTMISIPQPTTSFGNNADPLQGDSTLESLSVAQLRTPTKFTHTPPATPKRKPRSLLTSTSGLKRLNSSPSAPTPKRSAARSLRL